MSICNVGVPTSGKSYRDILRETVGLTGARSVGEPVARINAKPVLLLLVRSGATLLGAIGDRCFAIDATQRRAQAGGAIGEFVQGPTPVSLHPRDHFRDCATCCTLDGST